MTQSRYKKDLGCAACTIPGMAGRVINISARILFFLSGLMSGAVAALYSTLRGAQLPRQSEWIPFAVVLGLASLFNVMIAILPVSWTAKIFRISDGASLLSRCLRMFGVFALFSYLVTVGFFFTPHEWNLGGYLWTYLLCPEYIVRETFDPRQTEIFLMFAPMNAAVYGALGTVAGLLVSRKQENG